MAKRNCWEFKKCGRQPGGKNVEEMGVCPAAICAEADGFCEGENGGRACMFITGTFCGGVIQGTHNEKKDMCEKCDFYKHLHETYGADCTVWTFATHVKEKKKK